MKQHVKACHTVLETQEGLNKCVPFFLDTNYLKIYIKLYIKSYIYICILLYNLQNEFDMQVIAL